MGLTQKRVQRVLDAWDKATAPAQESYFNGHLVICAAGAVLCLIFGAYWIAALFLGLTLMILRLLWERPGSKVRRMTDALMRRGN
jgi:hypothetical protein